MNLPANKKTKRERTPSAKNNGQFYRSPVWRATRLKVLERDGYCCTHTDSEGNQCRKRDDLEVDHVKAIPSIVANGMIVNHSAILEACETTNLQTLCKHHHAQKSGRERAQK